MGYFVSYVTVLIVFGLVDVAWLSTMGKMLYRPALGDILLPGLRIAPAVAFYLIYPIGIVVLAVTPARTTLGALVAGCVFGAIAYATYDLTNYATLRNWTLQITLIDIGYGAVLSGIAATAAFLVTRATTS
jgi:uncharacterized membrane protein